MRISRLSTWVALAALLPAMTAAACAGPPPVAEPRAATSAATAPSAVAGIGGLVSLAFVSPADGYGLFARQSGARCQGEVGRTTDGGARFSTLVRVSSWPCAENVRAMRV